jgi:acyl-CoA synthetase (AMP-forming)/AMP-acid ligase II
MSARHFRQLLEDHARRQPDAPALLAPGRASLSYGRLFQQIEEGGRALRALGIGRRDRVSVIMPNGPDLVAAILTVATNAVCAPMNPAYGARELEGYFADLMPRALLTVAGFDSPARAVAQACGITTIELVAEDGAEAGVFVLVGDRTEAAPDEAPGRPDDGMITLFTSGTTARPKIVPLTHANVCQSAYANAQSLALEPMDRCLNVLPLFHGHGLTATVMASFAAGASLVAAPGCDVQRFFGWLMEFRPTWYSAVPTMHQAILAEARRLGPRAATHRLRLIRSASAPLPPQMLEALEQTFATAVIEFYGMTETASSPIACNPLPPGRRKAGAVGLPIDLSVALMDESGHLLPSDATGEVVVRGASVTAGYDNDEAANRAAFVDGWFRTGDLGFFDGDGYLVLTGRSKEIINRGGEKVTPWEVDEALLEHPAVAEAVTFALPHPTLGEDVGAAVVLRPQMTAAPKDIRQFVIGRIADFKVPQQVLVVDKLPRGPTGKVNRIGLASALGFGAADPARPPRVAPRTPLEGLLAERWARILKSESIGIHDDFFALGGDSLAVTRLAIELYDVLGLELDTSRFFATPTIADTARDLESPRQSEPARSPAALIAPRSGDETAPASVGQEELWRLQSALAGRPYFNVFCPLRLASPVDEAILKQSLNAIVQRHDILRTTFIEEGGRCLQSVSPCMAVDLAIDDLTKLPASRREAAGQQIIQEAALVPFDLARGPLIAARLLRLAKRDHLLLITLHGIVVDAWSLRVLVDEILTAYDALSAGEAVALSPLAIQYGDFAQWQRNWRSRPDVVAQLDWWRNKLCGRPPEMWPAAALNARAIDHVRTAQREVALPAALTEAAKSFSLREGSTLYMTLLAALKTALHRLLDEDDLWVATLAANRGRPGTDRLIGPLANTVILRTSLAGNPSLREVLHRVRTTTLAALGRQDLPFEDLAGALARDRGAEATRLSRVMFALHSANLDFDKERQHRITLDPTNSSMLGPLMRPMAFDLTLMLREGADGLVGSCIYKPHLFDEGAVGRMLEALQKVLHCMVAHPEHRVSTVQL